MLEIEQLKCFQNHNNPICSVIIDKDCNKNERLLCTECIQDFNKNFKIKGFNTICQQLDNNLNYTKDQIKSFLLPKTEILKILKEQINDWKSFVLNQINTILRIVNDWAEQLTPENIMNFQQSFIDLLDQSLRDNDYNQKEFEQKVNMILTINQASFQKIYQKLKEFNLQNKQIFDKLKQAFLDIGKDSSPLVELKLITKQREQSDNCWATSFNYTGQIMASGFGNIIKIWNFQDGKICECNQLEGHSNVVSCLIFSKYCNSLISSSYDNSIRLWQLAEEQEWKKSAQYIKHTDRILCLILDKDEKTLISGSNDSTIKVWSVDFKEFQLYYSYSLIKHKNRIYGLALNESENYLVSCAEDCQIIVWQKAKNNQWEFQQVVSQSIKEWGTKIAFIQENQFIWITGQQNGSDCICFFELKDDSFQEQQEKTLKLKVNKQVIDYIMFPIMIDNRKNFILFRHKLHIYILKKKIHGKYNVTATLQFYDNATFGAITNDSKFLVIWEDSQNYYSIYGIENFWV